VIRSARSRPNSTGFTRRAQATTSSCPACALLGKKPSEANDTDLLTKDGRRPWKTVEAFVSACEHTCESSVLSRVLDGARPSALARPLQPNCRCGPRKGANSRWPSVACCRPARTASTSRRHSPEHARQRWPAARTGCYLLHGLGGTGKTQLAWTGPAPVDGGGGRLLVWVNAASRSNDRGKIRASGREARHR